jgi:phosphate transport system substrate-binding protein
MGTHGSHVFVRRRRHYKKIMEHLMFRRSPLLVAWIATLALLPAHAENIRMAGSGTNAGAIELMIAEFRKQVPNAQFAPVEVTGSAGAIRAVAGGALHIALISRPLADNEKSMSLASTEYARTPFVIAVRADSKMKTISNDQLTRFFSGTVDSGPDFVRVRPVLRPVADIDNQLLGRMASGMGPSIEQALKRPGMMVATNDREAADLVERNVGAIGATTLGLIMAESRQLRALALDGQQPTLSAFETGKYTHHKRLFLVFSEKNPLPADAKRFVEFASSNTAKTILRRTGHIVPPFPAMAD